MFEPLLLEECCAQILRGVEEGEVLTPHPCAVATSDSVSGGMNACVSGKSCMLRTEGHHRVVLHAYQQGPEAACHVVHHCGRLAALTASLALFCPMALCPAAS